MSKAIFFDSLIRETGASLALSLSGLVFRLKAVRLLKALVSIR